MCPLSQILGLHNRLKYLDSDGSYNGPLELGITDKLEIEGGGSIVAIKVGSLSSDTPGSGVELDATTTRAMEIHADDNNTARAVGTQGRAIFGRMMAYADNACEDWGVHGLSKFSGVAKTGNVSAGVVGAFESTGTCSTATGSGNTFCAGVMGRLGGGGTFTIGSGTLLAGVMAFYNTLTAKAFTNTGTCAFLATASDIAGTGDWDYGLYLDSNTCTTGITVGTTAEKGLYVTGTWGAGFDNGAICIGTGSTAIEHGSVADSVVVERVNVTAQITGGNYFMGKYMNLASSGSFGATGFIMGNYTKVTVAHLVQEVYGVRGRVCVDATQTGDTSNQFIGMFGAVELAAVAFALADTGGCYGVLGTAGIASGGTLDQPLLGGYFECNPESAIAGLTCASRHRMIGYTDYGIDVLCQTNNHTAAIRIAPEQSAKVAVGISFEVAAGSGKINHIMKFEDSTSCGVNTSGNVGGAQQSDAIIKIDVAGTDYYVPAFTATNVTGDWSDF